MASVAVGGRVEQHQIGDVTINEQTDLVFMEVGGNAALLEKRTTIAEIPQADGTVALVAGVEVTTTGISARNQPKEQEMDLPGTERIPENKPTRAPCNTTTPATDTARRPAAHKHNTYQYPTTQRYYYGGALPALDYADKPCQECLDSFYILPSEWKTPWHKCLCCFYVLWMVLLTFLGLIGVGYVGLGGLIHKCRNITATGEFDINQTWLSSFVTGGIMVSFTLCIWLSCGAYLICCREKKGLCMGLMTGCGVAACVSFIVAFYFNYISIDAMTDISPSNGTLAECLPPYQWSYVPPAASVVVTLVLIVSLCCCLVCKGCFYCYRDFNNYDRF